MLDTPYPLARDLVPGSSRHRQPAFLPAVPSYDAMHETGLKGGQDPSLLSASIWLQRAGAYAQQHTPHHNGPLAAVHFSCRFTGYPLRPETAQSAHGRRKHRRGVYSFLSPHLHLCHPRYRQSHPRVSQRAPWVRRRRLPPCRAASIGHARAPYSGRPRREDTPWCSLSLCCCFPPIARRRAHDVKIEAFV